jgi:hypothetical protein
MEEEVQPDVKVTLGVISPSPDEPISYYRAFGPFSKLKQKYPLFNLVEMDANKVNWQTLGTVDGIFMSRPSNIEHLNAAKQAIANGKFVWCDWDDHLLAIPRHHPVYQLYVQRQPIVVQLARMSTVVTVTNGYLHSIFSEYNKMTHTIENAVDWDWYKQLKWVESTVKNRFTVLWRGSAVHIENLRKYSQDIIETVNNNPDIYWIFQGFDPWFVTQNIPEDSLKIIPWRPIPEYFIQMLTHKPDVVMFPFDDTPFDRSHSCVGWLEATMAGAVSLVPDWETWRHSGVVIYGDRYGSFKDTLNKLVTTDKTTLHRMNVMSLQEVETEFTIDIMNEKRWKTLQMLKQGRVSINLTVNPTPIRDTFNSNSLENILKLDKETICQEKSEEDILSSISKEVPLKSELNANVV